MNKYHTYNEHHLEGESSSYQETHHPRPGPRVTGLSPLQSRAATMSTKPSQRMPGFRSSPVAHQMLVVFKPGSFQGFSEHGSLPCANLHTCCPQRVLYSTSLMSATQTIKRSITRHGHYLDPSTCTFTEKDAHANSCLAAIDSPTGFLTIAVI
jgi:hypothetical protein